MVHSNSYTVYDRAGVLLASERLMEGGGAEADPKAYFKSLAPDIQGNASVLLVFQTTLGVSDGGHVFKHRVTREPTLGPGVDLEAETF